MSPARTTSHAVLTASLALSCAAFILATLAFCSTAARADEPKCIAVGEVFPAPPEFAPPPGYPPAIYLDLGREPKIHLQGFPAQRFIAAFAEVDPEFVERVTDVVMLFTATSVPHIADADIRVVAVYLDGCFAAAAPVPYALLRPFLPEA